MKNKNQKSKQEKIIYTKFLTLPVKATVNALPDEEKRKAVTAAVNALPEDERKKLHRA